MTLIELPPPGPHGGDAARVAAALGLNPASLLELSATMNPVAPDPVRVLRRHLDALGAYPDPTRATAALAERLGIDALRVVLTNGGSEAITLLAGAIGGRTVEPAFSLYPRNLDGPLWSANPHSPFGTLAPPDAVADVWDEAFWHLAAGTWTRGDTDRGTFVLGSLTKLFAAPGLRMGYLIVPDSDEGERVRDRVVAAQPHWSVGGLVCAGLPDFLATADLPRWCAEISVLRARTAALLCEAGLSVTDTDSPWLLVSGARQLRTRLAHLGVVVRDCASFGLADTVRIAVPRAEDLPRLAAALDRLAGPLR